jgi:GNAT superfamily N-acetyltransferase
VEIKGKIVGTAWVHIMNDYGYIDDETPSFAMSLYEEYRNMVIGTALMRDLLEILKNKGYKQTPFSVQKTNYAVRMYRKQVLRLMMKMKKNTSCFVGCNAMRRECVSGW